jgi:hypothetical protein
LDVSEGGSGGRDDCVDDWQGVLTLRINADLGFLLRKNNIIDCRQGLILNDFDLLFLFVHQITVLL